MGQREVLNLLIKNQGIWHSTTYLKNKLKIDSNVYKSLKSLVKDKTIEKTFIYCYHNDSKIGAYRIK